MLQWQGVSAADSLWLLFTVYAVGGLFWRGIDRPANSLLALVIDITSFLLWLYAAGEPFPLLSCAFCIYVLLFAALIHTWRETLIAGFCVAMFILITRPIAATQLSVAVWVASFVAITLSLQKHMLQQRLSATIRQAALFRVEAEKARDTERQRIAADFHDGPLQSFISFQVRLEIVRKLALRDPATGMQELEQLQALCRTQVAELRSFIRGMRPPEDDGTGLITAAGRLVELFQKDTGIVATFHRGKSFLPDEPETSIEILQVVREALNNVQKHSKASRVAVSMERLDGYVELSVEDDGTGFPFAGCYTLEELEALRLGPVSIKRRVKGLGGEMTLDSRPGFGVGMQIRIPL